MQIGLFGIEGIAAGTSYKIRCFQNQLSGVQSISGLLDKISVAMNLSLRLCFRSLSTSCETNINSSHISSLPGYCVHTMFHYVCTEEFSIRDT